MDRRSFLASLLATAVLDPEKLLWVPVKNARPHLTTNRLVLMTRRISEEQRLQNYLLSAFIEAKSLAPKAPYLI